MILSIDSSIDTFKRLEFKEGLNVLLSDSSPGASEKQTRNSAGKTSFLEVVHFLLGSNCPKESLFRTPDLVEHSFDGAFSFWGVEYHVQRSGSQPSRIYLLGGSHKHLSLPMKDDKDTGRRYISNENWKAFLGHALFGLPTDAQGSIFSEPFTPSFRSMLSYFARRHDSGGFISPERQAESQQQWDWQENLSYLLGLDWQVAREFQLLKSREKAIKDLKKAARGGAFGGIIGAASELRSELTVAERKATQRRTQLENFQVLDAYQEKALQAARCKSRMQLLAREIVGLQETHEHLERAILGEVSPSSAAISEVYESVGIQLPDIALRRLQDVEHFYESVVANRKYHLSREIESVSIRVLEKQEEIARLDREREEILVLLESRGALEDFISLQQDLADLEAEAASLRERFRAAELLEGEAIKLDIDRGVLHSRLQQDFRERRAALSAAILSVEDTISELYDDRNGRLKIDATEKGPAFTISIEGDRGGGIKNMEIFCLDLAVFQINVKKRRGPGFLIHDSHLFDGVDERQVARAIDLGARAADGAGLQYIVTMNSDIYDRLPPSSSVDRDTTVLKTRLSDETDSGGLFGFRFG